MSQTLWGKRILIVYTITRKKNTNN